MILSRYKLIMLITKAILSTIIIFSILMSGISERIINDQYRHFYLFMAKVEEYKQNILLIGLLADKSIKISGLENKKEELASTEYKFGIYSIEDNKLNNDEVVIINMAIDTFSNLPSFLYKNRFFLYYRSYSGNKYITSKQIDGFSINESMFKRDYCDIRKSCTIFIQPSALDDRIIISNIYKDLITKKNILTLSSPVHKDSEIIGDFNIDIYLDEYGFIKNKSIKIDRSGVYKNIIIEDTRYPFYNVSFIKDFHADNRTTITYKIPVFKIIIDKYWVFLAILFASIGVIWKLMILSDKKIKLLKAELLINKDELTGLYNRSIFNDEAFITIKNTKNIAIIVIDGNKLKEINDNYGHHVGDEAIKQIASGMKLTFRKNDYLIRYGGDEFLVLLPNCNLEVAEKLSIELKHNVSNTRFSRHSINIEVSVGLAMSLIDEDLEYSINKADEMLYKEKSIL